MIFRVFQVFEYASHVFFLYKQNFYKQRQAEIGKKNQAKAKQHPEAELLLFENYLLSSSTLRYHPKIISHILKNKCVYFSILMRSYD